MDARELTRDEKKKIRSLVMGMCANYDRESDLCLPLDCACYMPVSYTHLDVYKRQDKGQFEEKLNQSIRQYNPEYWRARQSGREAAEAARSTAPAKEAAR